MSVTHILDYVQKVYAKNLLAAAAAAAAADC